MTITLKTKCYLKQDMNYNTIIYNIIKKNNNKRIDTYNNK